MINAVENFLKSTDSGLLAIANSSSKLWTKTIGKDKSDLANICMTISPFLDAIGLLMLKPKNLSKPLLAISLDFAYSFYMSSIRKSDFDIKQDKHSPSQDLDRVRMYGSAALLGAFACYSHSIGFETLGSALLGTGLLCKATHSYILRSGD